MGWFSSSKTPPSEKAQATANRSVLNDKTPASDKSTDDGKHGYSCDCRDCRMERRKESNSSDSVWSNGWRGSGPIDM